MQPTVDPTAIQLDDHRNSSDPLVRRMSGYARHGNTPFDVPFISHIAGNLYTGGCENGLVLPRNIENLISLYPWEQYRIRRTINTRLEVAAYDSVDDGPSRKMISRLVQWGVECLQDGPTLIHCQAGLNRSALIAALVLVEGYGLDPAAAIDLLRQRRSPAVLCNPAFFDFVRSWGG